MGPPPPVQVADSSTPIGTPGQLPPIRVYTPSPLGLYLPPKESTSAFPLPVRQLTISSPVVSETIPMQIWDTAISHCSQGISTCRDIVPNGGLNVLGMQNNMRVLVRADGFCPP